MRRRRWVWWTVLAVAALVPASRLAIAVVNAQELGAPEVLLITLPVGALLIVGLCWLATRSVGRGLPALRATHPAAIVAAVSVLPEDLDVFRQLTKTKLGGPNGLLVDATFEADGVSFWRGSQPKRLATIHGRGVRYEVGEVTTIAGTFPALMMKVLQPDGWYTLRLTPASGRGKLFPRQLSRSEIESLVADLNSLVSP